MSLRLEIATTPTIWETVPQPARLSLSTTLPRVEITTEAAKVEITGNHPGELSIDFTECRAALGLKTVTQMTEDWAEAGKQAALEAIGNMAAAGDRLMDYKSGDAIVEMAQDSMIEDTPSIEWAYKPGPEINYTPNKPEITVTPGNVEVQLQRGMVQNDTPFPAMHYQITQYGRVDISVVGSRTDQSA